MKNVPVLVHPSQISGAEGFKHRWEKSKDGHHEIKLDTSVVPDYEMFKRLFPDFINFARVDSKDLASFDGLKPFSNLLDALCVASRTLLELRSSQKEHEDKAKDIQAEIDGNDKPELSEGIVKRLEEQERRARVARAEATATENQVATLKARLMTEIEAKRAARAEEVMELLRSGKEAFNRTMIGGYAELTKLFPLYAELSQLKPGSFPPDGFAYSSPFINDLPTGTKLKTFRGVPQIVEENGLFMFKVIGMKK